MEELGDIENEARRGNTGTASQGPSAPLGALVDVVRLELLEAVTPELLLRFLRPFASYLARRGVQLEDVAVDDAWLGQLHQVLNAVDPAMPAELQQGLIDIADLTSESAHEQVLVAARERQLSLFTAAPTTTPEDLAFTIFLDHRDVFRHAHARTQSSEIRRFVEFVGKDLSPPEGASSGAKHARLAHRLGRWFQERNRTAFCSVRAVETEAEVRFLIIHGQPPRTHGAIESVERRGRVSYVRDKHDAVVFDRRTGKLGVNAQFVGEQDLYRRSIGAVFWGDEEHFAAQPLFSGEPLRERGSAAVRPHGVPGVVSVALRAISVTSEVTAGDVVAWTGPDVAQRLDSELGRLVRQEGQVSGFRLDVTLAGKPRPVRVDVRVPNHLSFDRRVGAPAIREYLLEAGFMTLPSVAVAG